MRIILHDNQQTAERAIELGIGSDFVLGGLRSAQRRACFGDIVEYGCFVRGESLHRFDEIRDQVRSPLENDVHLRPIGFHLLIESHHLIAPRHVHSAKKQRDHYYYHDHNQRLLHERPPAV